MKGQRKKDSTAMTTKKPRLQHDYNDGLGIRSSIHKRILLLITCLGMLAIVGMQYYSVAINYSSLFSSSASSPLLLSKDYFMAGGVIEFRRNIVAGAASELAQESNPIMKKKLEDEKRKPAEDITAQYAQNEKQQQVEIITVGGEKEIADDKSVHRLAKDTPLDYNGTPLHVVFSTSCSEQMDWESYVFFYHAWKVKQPGTVTRIASGCNAREAQDAKKFFEKSIKTMSDRFYLHLTPDFSRQRMFEKGGYKYMNKPFGLRDWLENEMQVHKDNRQEEIEDGVVILMDPDMILLRPILHDYTKEDVIWVEENPPTRIVKHGYPIAQQDGYLNNKWMTINGTFITGDPKIGRPKDKFGPLHWNTGPPYLATVKDMYEIAKLWTVYAPRVDHINPGLFAEMQGFIWATYKLNLPHTLIKSLVVSNSETPHREGWTYVDNLPDDQVCIPSDEMRKSLPVALHYCSRYALSGDFFFSKYRLKKNILKCEKNLLLPPPKDIHLKYDYFMAPPPADGRQKKNPEKKVFSKKEAKRQGFMLCGMIDAVNEAVAYYKTNNCGSKGNFNKVYTIKNDPGKY